MSDTGQEPTKPNNDTPDTPMEPTQPEPPKKFDEEYVKGLRSESAKYRKELRDTQTRLAEFEAAQEAAKAKELEAQGEWQKLAEQNAARAKELEAQIAQQQQQLANERRNRLAVGAATALGAIDPTDANVIAAVAHIDINGDEAEAEIRAALEGLKEKRPYLFGNRQANLTSFNPSGSEVIPRETRQQALDRIYGGGSSNMFDPVEVRRTGGGVIFKE